jgi:ribosomal protein L16 Arg81 hydroxylase
MDYAVLDRTCPAIPKTSIGSTAVGMYNLSGSVIFVPHGWWHSVINLDDMTITHNYISPSNLGNALKFFTEKHDQISGCQDRAESIKQVHIHDELVPVLGDKEAHHLKRALEQKCWTRRAWADNQSRISHENEEPNNSTDQIFPIRKRNNGLLILVKTVGS